MPAQGLKLMALAVSGLTSVTFYCLQRFKIKIKIKMFGFQGSIQLPAASPAAVPAQSFRG